MLNRHLRAFGLSPILGYLLGLLVFIGASFYLFYKTAYAPYIYAFFAFSALSLLSETKRNDFLKTCFVANEYPKIRALENGLVSLPFLLFLGYQQAWLVLIGVLVMAIVMATTQFNNQLNYRLPTPFYHFPFEFLVGFRTAFMGVFFAYFLTIMGISVENFNLGAFAILMLYMISFSFYAQPDSQYYVWIFSDTPKGFLFNKLVIAFAYSLLLILPVLVGLGYFFSEQLRLLVLLPIIGYLYLSTIILAKYAAFPKAMNLPETLLIMVAVFFPPFLLFLIPFFYNKASKKLAPVLSGY